MKINLSPREARDRAFSHGAGEKMCRARKLRLNQNSIKAFQWMVLLLCSVWQMESIAFISNHIHDYTNHHPNHLISPTLMRQIFTKKTWIPFLQLPSEIHWIQINFARSAPQVLPSFMGRPVFFPQMGSILDVTTSGGEHASARFHILQIYRGCV